MPVRFMHGNRDFLVAHAFAESTGIGLIADPTVLDLYGTKTALLHGDTLCTDDIEYQKFRAQTRDPRWQQAVLARPIAERVTIAQGMRAQSEGVKAGKEAGIMDVAPAAVDEAFRACGCDLMIHGHTHRPGRHEHDVDGRKRVRWVLPDWYEKGGYLEASPGGVRALAA
jgi:UDP-2,3-diacylglucosamine hydrolase